MGIKEICIDEYYISWEERTEKCIRVCADNKEEALRKALNTIAFCDTNYVTDGNEIKDIRYDVQLETFKFTDKYANKIEGIDVDIVSRIYDEL